MDSLQEMDLAHYINQSLDFLVKRISDIGKWSLNFFIAVILSFFFLMEKEKVRRFISNMKRSKAGWFFRELESFGGKFLQSFGKVIEVQFMIATVNCILSTLLLWLMGFPHFNRFGRDDFRAGSHSCRRSDYFPDPTLCHRL